MCLGRRVFFYRVFCYRVFGVLGLDKGLRYRLVFRVGVVFLVSYLRIYKDKFLGVDF